MRRLFTGSITCLKYLEEKLQNDLSVSYLMHWKVTVMPWNWNTLPSKNYPRSKLKDHIHCLNERLSKWLEVDSDSVMHECQSIQNHLCHQ